MNFVSIVCLIIIWFFRVFVSIHRIFVDNPARISVPFTEEKELKDYRARESLSSFFYLSTTTRDFALSFSMRSSFSFTRTHINMQISTHWIISSLNMQVIEVRVRENE
mmetsp:Transcript_32437/g.23965  ORF Transcript_32437/g.23965 Transcript_32437/m.23965 type:complete len:108 (-) Transcript_32437:27-350(-)